MDFVTTIRENARRHGNRRGFTFVSEKGGLGRAYQEDVLGLADLDLRARALAGSLQSRGMHDKCVLLLYPEGLEFVTAFLGCLYARAVAVPSPLPALNSTRVERTQRIIRDADVELILTDSDHREVLDDWLREIGLAGQVRCQATDIGVEADPSEWSAPRITPDALAFLQYSSGSTGDPNGVMVSHGNLLHNMEEIKRCVRGSSDTIGVSWIPHYHDMGLVGQLLQPMYLGCRYVITAPLTFLKRPVLWLELISRHRATNTVAPNFGYDLCLRRVTDDQLNGLDLACLLIAQNGAEPIRAATLERMAERFGAVGFRPEAWMPSYGMAETTLLITGARMGPGAVIDEFDIGALAHNEAVSAASGRRLVSSGRAIGLDVRIVDPETHTALPSRRVGEIWVRGGSVTQGYWKRPAETQTIFRAITADGDGPFLRTGDLGFIADGELYVTGRIKDVIIVNGRNIYAHDIEEAARSAHPAARTAAAFSVDTGKEHVVVVQEVNKAAARATGLPELAALTRDTIARELGLPALSVVLTKRGTVRRTTSGKIQRSLTRRAFLDGEIAELASDLEPDLAALRLANA